MNIKEITGGYVTVEIEVSTCLAIASACHLASNMAHDDKHPIHGQTFGLLWSAFEAFALVGAAHGSMSPAEYAGCTLPQVKAEWGTLPLIVGGKEVVR